MLLWYPNKRLTLQRLKMVDTWVGYNYNLLSFRGHQQLEKWDIVPLHVMHTQTWISKGSTRSVDGKTFLSSVTFDSGSDESDARLLDYHPVVAVWITRCLGLSSSNIFSQLHLGSGWHREGQRYQSRTISHCVVKQTAAEAAMQVNADISLSICSALSCIYWLPPNWTGRFFFSQYAHIAQDTDTERFLKLLR